MIRLPNREREVAETPHCHLKLAWFRQHQESCLVTYDEVPEKPAARQDLARPGRTWRDTARSLALGYVIPTRNLKSGLRTNVEGPTRVEHSTNLVLTTTMDPQYPIEGDDWRNTTNAKERKKIQDRLAQRARRKFCTFTPIRFTSEQLNSITYLLHLRIMYSTLLRPARCQVEASPRRLSLCLARCLQYSSCG
jgi:hypothetical protein